MTMSDRTLVLCPCGEYHPVGFICATAQRLGNQHSRDTDICSSYHIPHMDCPTEETLIRQKLAGLPGITDLKFNLLQRMLTVRHSLPSAKIIEEALQAIDMAPEPLPTQAATTLFSISAMDCPVEEKLIQSKLKGMPGVLSLEFNLMQRTLRVQHEPSALKPVLAALTSLNMGARLLDTQAEKDQALPASNFPWARLLAAGTLALLSEGIDLLQTWKFSLPGMDLSMPGLWAQALLEYLPLIFAIAAIALGGLTTYKKGWLAVSSGNLNINALMSVAVTGAVIIGQYPEAAMVMVLFNLSEAIEARSLDKARKAIKNLLALAPETASVQQADGTWQAMESRSVLVGSRVRVQPGEKIALDGTVVSGLSMVNQAPITGESMPVEKKGGDSVFAGTINTFGSFEFTVTAKAEHSTLARIIHAVEEAQGSRAPMQRFVDTFARYYTPAIFLVAILCGIIPPLLLGRTWAASVYTALVILVIGCPCALVISTPISLVSGIAAATRYGILIKGGMFLEQGRLLKWLALDKTGTITLGQPRQTDFIRTGQMDEEHIASLAASLAARSDHPVSKAIAQNADEAGIQLRDVEQFAALPGQGVSGRIDGEVWRLGNQRMVERLGHGSAALEKRILSLEEQGKTVVALMGAKGVQGLFAVADTVRNNSIGAIRELKQLGVQTVMLTGDNKKTAEAIARQVGVDEFRAELLPEDKLVFIEQLEQRGEGKVGMAGDGINDAPALAKADVGFAMARGGSDTAIETADVALMDDDLRKIPRFIRLSRATYAILVQNITLALAIKALFFGLTIAGSATMWMAVFADMGTSLLVVANGLRAMKK